MEETAHILDTHADIQELIKSGMPEPQAETVVRQRIRLMDHHSATKADIEKLRLETKADIAEINANIEKLRLETKADIAETNANIAQSKNDMIKWVVGVGFGIVTMNLGAIKLFLG